MRQDIKNNANDAVCSPSPNQETKKPSNNTTRNDKNVMSRVQRIDLPTKCNAYATVYKICSLPVHRLHGTSAVLPYSANTSNRKFPPRGIHTTNLSTSIRQAVYNDALLEGSIEIQQTTPSRLSLTTRPFVWESTGVASQ